MSYGQQQKRTETMTKTTLCAACYTLIKAEVKSLCECLYGVKVYSGYSGNIRKLVDIKTQKLVGMKSHECHVMITQILPVVIKGLMEPGI